MRDFMIGNIAVGVVIVDGKTGTEAEFTWGERLTTATAISKGFDILYRLKDAAGAGLPKIPLFFMARIDWVKLDLDPGLLPAPSTAATRNFGSAEFERREQLWRDPALNKLGYSSGRPGISSYMQNLLALKWAAQPAGPDTAYVAFVTKYMANWPAYADPFGSPAIRVTMCYSWLVDQTPVNPLDHSGGFRNSGAMGNGESMIQNVFAHESCHIFGAPDEYRVPNGIGCTNANAGHLATPNSNCEVVNPSSVDCLMKNLTQVLCGATPSHLGWADQNQNGILDVFE